MIKFTPRTPNQEAYVESIRKNKITFGIGPAGTGKTFLAVSYALQELNRKRLILVRPAVDADEELGFTPGTVDEKMDPYVQPFYDSMLQYLTFKEILQLKRERQIEICAISYMRGRSFIDCNIIVDEAQNTTVKQMKMILTRMGVYTKLIINGDPTQTDIEEQNGLGDALIRLKDLPATGFCNLGIDDVQRDPLVKEILQRYERPNA